MAQQDRYDPMEPSETGIFADGSSARPLVVGTVPRDRRPSLYMASRSGPIGDYASITGAGNSTTRPSGGVDEKASFPFEITEADLQRGQQRFTIYCSMCHGQTGEGDGMIVTRGFTRPPSYFPIAAHKTQFPDLYVREQSLLNQTPGHYYNVITNGWGAMYSYGERVSPDDRWRIAAYIKTLQYSRTIKLAELSPDDQQKVNQQPATATPETARDEASHAGTEQGGGTKGGTVGGSLGGASSGHTGQPTGGNGK